LSQNTLDFSDISEDLTLLIDSSNTLSLNNILNNGTISLLDENALEFSLEDIDTIIGGKGQNTFLFEEGATFDGTIDSSLGINDTLALSGEDRTWEITGFDTGIVDNINFKGIENLKGGDDNQDTFVFESSGHISGIIDGGDAGFDTLSLLGNHDTISYSAKSPNSGTVNRDNDIITYFGLEPIYDNTNTANR
ncbi:parallel beta-helix repeat-containing protein, partial [Candidatus Magnetomorum sp. HK-1]